MLKTIKLKIYKRLLIYCLNLHSFFYKISNKILGSSCFGDHPKHNFVNYNLWFKSHIPRKSVVLDIGCHIGKTTFELSKSCKLSVGFDIDINRISYAINKYKDEKNVLFLHSDVTSYDFSKQVSNIFIEYSNHTFVLILSNVLEHINDRKTFLQKILHAVGGNHVAFLIRVPDLNRDWIVPYKKSLKLEYLLDPTHFIEFTKEEIINLIESVGIIIVSYENRFGEHYIVGKLNA
jgi:SAM-dependent methyltransferase